MVITQNLLNQENSLNDDLVSDETPYSKKLDQPKLSQQTKDSSFGKDAQQIKDLVEFVGSPTASLVSPIRDSKLPFLQKNKVSESFEDNYQKLKVDDIPKESFKQF